MKTKTKTKPPLRAWDASDEPQCATLDARTVANAMRDYADRWRANGTRVPADVLRVWAEFVEGQEVQKLAAQVNVKAAKRVARRCYAKLRAHTVNQTDCKLTIKDLLLAATKPFKGGAK